MRTCSAFILVAAAVSGIWRQTSVRAEGTKTPRTTNDQQASRSTGSLIPEKAELEQATFGLGCYSCAEAMFERLKGVESVVVGYSGGSVKNPTDEQIHSGLSGHAEVVQVSYNPKTISYDELLEVFWKMHDPTTLNRQGKNVGTQYRSVIFYHNDKQHHLAEGYKKKLNESHIYANPIVTEIAKYSEFYPASKDHQGFFRLNPKDEYCTLVIQPKVDEFAKVFADKVRTSPGKAASKP
jgi:peptide-methionine (S)-S-oxide reductase